MPRHGHKRGKLRPGANMGMSMAAPGPTAIAGGMMTFRKAKPLGRPATEEMRAERAREREARCERCRAAAEAKRQRKAARAR